jgi:hypothetical protein
MSIVVIDICHGSLEAILCLTKMSTKTGMDAGLCQESQTMVFEIWLDSSPYKRSKNSNFLTIFYKKVHSALKNGL